MAPASAMAPSRGMEEEDDEHVDQQPGRVEEREDAVAGEEAAQRSHDDVAQAVRVLATTSFVCGIR